MATRKIRLTLSGTKVNDIGPIVDIDFNGENLESDLEITAEHDESPSLVKEYTVDVDVGTYNLDFQFKNDLGDPASDRNFHVDKVEFANNGTDYTQVVLNESNTSGNLQITICGYIPNGSLNPDYNESLTRTDSHSGGYVRYTDPGSNSKYQYDYVSPASVCSAVIYTQEIVSVQISAE